MALLLQLLEQLPHALAQLLLLGELLDARLQLVVRLPLRHLRLVLLVERLGLVVGLVGNGVHVVALQPLLQRLSLALRLVLEQPAADQLVEQAAPLIIEVGQGLHFGLAKLGTHFAVALQVAVGDGLAVHLRHFGRRVDGNAGLAGRRSAACLAGDEGECAEQDGVQSAALHASLRIRRTAHPRRRPRIRQ